MLLKSITVAAAAVAALGVVSADEKKKPWELKKNQVKPPKGGPLDYFVSGYWFRTKKTRSLQDDDFENPGYL